MPGGRGKGGPPGPGGIIPGGGKPGPGGKGGRAAGGGKRLRYESSGQLLDLRPPNPGGGPPNPPGGGPIPMGGPFMGGGGPRC
jgi:hypothetical protein